MVIRSGWLGIVLLGWAMPVVAAPPDVDAAAEDPIAVETAWVGSGAAPDPSCENPDPLLRPGEGTIVVCRRVDRDKYRVPSSAEDQPLSAGATRTGALTPPDLGSGVNCGCPHAHCGGWAPPPIYYIDVTKLPMPAPGTDADKIAKGEAPAP